MHHLPRIIGFSISVKRNAPAQPLSLLPTYSFHNMWPELLSGLALRHRDARKPNTKARTTTRAYRSLIDQDFPEVGSSQR